jgi:hypothetical protein
MPIARWKALSEQAKQIWDTMADDDKALILALHEKRKEGPQSDQSKFSVNTHTATLTQDTPPDNIDDVLLAMVTQHSNRSTRPRSHPGYICSVLSQPTTKAAKAQVQDHKISVNGHTYVRQVQSRDIQYSVSQASRRKKSSLIDRGANGGITGNAILIERLIFVASTATISLPFLLSLLELWRNLNGGMSFL